MGQTETALAKFTLDFPTEDVPVDVMHLAKRCLMNYSGVALLANLDPAIDILLDVLRATPADDIGRVVLRGEFEAAGGGFDPGIEPVHQHHASRGWRGGDEQQRMIAARANSGRGA